MNKNSKANRMARKAQRQQKENGYAPVRIERQGPEVTPEWLVKLMMAEK